MNDRQAFLDAISANQYDDIVKLVFADWLDEHGECDLAAQIRLLQAPISGVSYPVLYEDSKRKITYTGSRRHIRADGTNEMRWRCYELTERQSIRDGTLLRGYIWRLRPNIPTRQSRQSLGDGTRR